MQLREQWAQPLEEKCQGQDQMEEPSRDLQERIVVIEIGLLDPDTLPVVGIESARKVLDPNLPSNLLITHASQQK